MTDAHPTLPRRRTGRRRTRRALRALHLAAGILLATFAYLPDTVPGREPLRWLLMVGVVPLITLTGLALWRRAAFARLLARRA